MCTLSETFDLARRHHQAGDLRQAEQLYRQVLNADGHNAEIWFLVAECCQGQGKLPDAISGYEQALWLQPDHVDARTNLGVAFATQRKLDEAVAQFTEALRLRPDYAKAHHNLGVALAEQGKLDEAGQSLRQAIRLKPDYAEAYYNLGNVLVSRNQLEEAVTIFKHALAIKPDYGEVYNNLGLVLIDLGKAKEAAVILQQAVRLRPVPDSYNNLGLALTDQGKFAEAEANYHQALHLNPNHADAHSNLGNSYKEQGRLEEAIACYQQALWLQPNLASTHWNRSLAWLQMGDYEKGWTEYEWRWKRKQTLPRPFPQPFWDGSPLQGRTILLHMEQGLGDMLQFIRYAPLVKDRGGTVIAECPASLIPLFSSCAGIDRLVPESSGLPDFQVHAPLMSLPRLFGTTLATIPAIVPYLKVDEHLVECWREKIGSAAQFKIGIAWQGNPHHKWDRHRSIPLAQFAPLASIPGVRLISLQKGPGAEQLKDMATRFPLMDPGPELDSASGVFMDTAAIIKNLDLVITTDTAVAHLAGAVAFPVWLALSAIADWRWMFQREDSPWYPTMRLFRQTELGNWHPVFEWMASEVEKLLSAKRSSGAIHVPVSPGELADKITILQIKSERIKDPEKLAHVRSELALLEKAGKESLPNSDELAKLMAELKKVNEALWQVEDDLRQYESEEDFGFRFIELARSVFSHNDARSALKGKINQLLNSPIAEQKEYSTYKTL